MNYADNYEEFLRAAKPYLIDTENTKRLFRFFGRVQSRLTIFVSREFYDCFRETWKDRVFFCDTLVSSESDQHLYVAQYIKNDWSMRIDYDYYLAYVEDTEIAKRFQAWLEKGGCDAAATHFHAILRGHK